MKKQITVFAFVGSFLIGGGYLLGANENSARLKNREPYTPTRLEWAEMWFDVHNLHIKEEGINTSIQIEDSRGESDEIVALLTYKNSTPIKILLK